MPKQALPLNDTKIRASEACDKPIHLFDGGGLFLLVHPKGGKWWRFKYQFAGKTKTISFATYPEISLKEARNRRELARTLVAHGTDPAIDRKEQKRAQAAQAITFEQVFHEWLDIEKTKLADATYNKIKTSMSIHALPCIGQLPIGSIGVDQLLTMLRAIEAQGALEMARRVRAWTSRVFRYGIITQHCERDPASDLRGALRVPQVKYHAALGTCLWKPWIPWRNLSFLARIMPIAPTKWRAN
jgi:hypothetical protein